MHPILFSIDALHLDIHVYGLMYALGFLAALLWVRYDSPRAGLPLAPMLDLFFYCLIAGTVGSRLLYVIVEEPQLFLTPLEVFKIWKGGLVFYGGLIGALAAGVWFCRRKKLPFWKAADVCAVSLSLGHVFGRIGCFFAGCCYGRQCDTTAWYAVVFPEFEHSIAPPGVPLYPTQLMEALGNLLVFVALVGFRKKKSFDGQVLLLYAILYAFMRGSIEFFRGDESRGYVVEGVLSTSQFISILAIGVALGLWIILRKRQRSR